jgi:serine/threonine protein kinase
MSPAADVYSMGCVIFECLTGAPPFTGEHAFAVLVKLMLETPARLRDRFPELPAALDELVASMLQKDPAQRPPNAEALLGAGIDRGRLAPVARRSRPRSRWRWCHPPGPGHQSSSTAVPLWWSHPSRMHASLRR